MTQAESQDQAAQVNLDEIRVVFKNMTHLYAAGDHEFDIPAHLSSKLQAKAYWLSRSFVQTGKHSLGNAKLVLFHANNIVESNDQSAVDLTQKQKEMNALREGLIAGETALNYLCQSANCSLQLYDLDPDTPVTHIDDAPAMNAQETSMALTYGMMSVEQQTECLLGDAFGQGTDVIARKLIALATSQDDMKGFDLLMHKGSREIAALCGAIIAARLSGVPAIVSGEIGLACMHILAQENRSAISHILWIPHPHYVSQSSEQDWPSYIVQEQQIPHVVAADMLTHYADMKLLATLLKAHKDDLIPTA